MIVPISMYIMITKYDDLIEAAKTLLWEKGFDATSPKAIQSLGNAGQGSFYHHFKSKKDLAAKAMEMVVDERIAAFERLFGDSGPILERIERVLLEPREKLKGCRIGRMVWDSAITQAELKLPIERYFRHVEERILEALEQASAAGEINVHAPREQIAAVVLAAIQGALTLGRAMQDSEWYDRTIQGANFLIKRALDSTP
jgi:TetR/AcrR family transcriptional repressor of nem operon